MAVDGFRATVAWLERLRPRLAEAAGAPVRFAWYLRMDPQITWLTGRPDGLARAIPDHIERLLLAGDTIGLHTHAGRWDGERWIADHGDAGWVGTCIESSADAYAQLFGSACPEHRFGDRWSGPALFDALVRAGIPIDVTIEPGHPGAGHPDMAMPATGRIPDYRSATREPLSLVDGRLWLLPLTSADPGPTMPALRRVVRRIRYLGQPLHRPLQLDRRWSTPESCWEVAEGRLAQMNPPYLAFVIRSDVAIREHAERTAAVMEALLRRPLARRLRFTDAGGVLRTLGLRTAPAPAAAPRMADIAMVR